MIVDRRPPAFYPYSTRLIRRGYIFARRTALMVAIVFGMTFLTACGMLPQKSGTLVQGDPFSLTLLKSVEDLNPGLHTFKGIGKLRFDHNGKKQHVRLAWIGNDSRQLRMELLALSGAPIMSISYDGYRLYVIDYHENKLHTEKSNGQNLSSVIGLPLSINDIAALLAGRVSLRPYQNVDFKKPNHNTDIVLLLKTKWGRVVQKIDLDSSKQIVKRVELIDRFGNNIATVSFSGELFADNFRIPHFIEIVAKEDKHFVIEVERYWPNVKIPSDRFVLSPPTTDG